MSTVLSNIFIVKYENSFKRENTLEPAKAHCRSQPFSDKKKEYLSIFLEIAETCQYFAPQSQLRCPIGDFASWLAALPQWLLLGGTWI